MYRTKYDIVGSLTVGLQTEVVVGGLPVSSFVGFMDELNG